MVLLINLLKIGRLELSRKHALLLIISLTFLVSVKALLPKDIQKLDFKRDWINVQIWAKENTSTETVFITPPYLEGFRIHSQRGIVAEVKDGAPGIYAIKFAIKWWHRMNDLGYKNLSITVLDFAPECKQGYNALSEIQLVSLGEKYKVSYVVVEKPRELNFKLVYQNEHFKVYSIGDV